LSFFSSLEARIDDLVARIAADAHVDVLQAVERQAFGQLAIAPGRAGSVILPAVTASTGVPMAACTSRPEWKWSRLSPSKLPRTSPIRPTTSCALFCGLTGHSIVAPWEGSPGGGSSAGAASPAAGTLM
jgi:hypothetical protein